MRTAARTFSFCTSVPAGSSVRAMTTSSSGWSRMVRSAACSMALPLQGMSRHQLVRMHPAGQRFDAIEPGLDGGKLAPAYAEFVGPVQVAAQREIGNRRLVADDKRALLEVQVEDDQRAAHAPAQELMHLRLAD